MRDNLRRAKLPVIFQQVCRRRRRRRGVCGMNRKSDLFEKSCLRGQLNLPQIRFQPAWFFNIFFFFSKESGAEWEETELKLSIDLGRLIAYCDMWCQRHVIEREPMTASPTHVLSTYNNFLPFCIFIEKSSPAVKNLTYPISLSIFRPDKQTFGM